MDFFEHQEKQIDINKIKINTGLLLDVAVLLFLLFIFHMFKKEPKTAIAFCICAGFLSVTAFLYVCTDTQLKNKSNDSVFAKAEESDEVIEVKPGETIYGLDGAKTKRGVYKITDGVHSVVCKDGRVWEKSFSSFLIDLVRGGNLSSPPDAGWQKLFDC